MAKVNVNFVSAKSMKFLDKRMGKRVGNRAVDSMRRLISQGISPVKGVRRFERYSGQRGGNYPQSVMKSYPGKKIRPVNLELNGWYLSFLTYWLNLRSKYISIGFSGKEESKQPLPKKARQFFEAHNEGMHPHVPRRKHLPNGPGDRFAVSVEREYMKVMEAEVARIVRMENKKR